MLDKQGVMSYDIDNMPEITEEFRKEAMMELRSIIASCSDSELTGMQTFSVLDKLVGSRQVATFLQAERDRKPS